MGSWRILRNGFFSFENRGASPASTMADSRFVVGQEVNPNHHLARIILVKNSRIQNVLYQSTEDIEVHYYLSVIKCFSHTVSLTFLMLSALTELDGRLA